MIKSSNSNYIYIVIGIAILLVIIFIYVFSILNNLESDFNNKLNSLDSDYSKKLNALDTIRFLNTESVSLPVKATPYQTFKAIGDGKVGFLAIQGGELPKDVKGGWVNVLTYVPSGGGDSSISQITLGTIYPKPKDGNNKLYIRYSEGDFRTDGKSIWGDWILMNS